MSGRLRRWLRRSPRGHKQTKDRPGDEQLEIRRQHTGAMSAATAVKQLLPARTKRRDHVLEIRRRSRNRAERRRIERAAPGGEQRDRGEAACDLEAAARDVLVRNVVRGNMQSGSKNQREHTRAGHRTDRGTGRNMQRDDHTVRG